MSPPQPIRLLGLINLITLKCLCAARIDKLADSNEPAKILFMQSNCKIVLTLIATSHIWEKAVISGLFRGGCTTVDPGFPRMAPILKRIPTYYLTKISPKTLWTWGNLGQERGASKILLCRSVTALCLPFVPACNNSNPLHRLISLHLLAHNISLCFWLCPSHSMLPFPPPRPCAFTPTCGPIMSSLHWDILCKYLDQPAHYSKYLDQFLMVLFETFRTGLVFAKQSKQGVTTLWSCVI